MFLTTTSLEKSTTKEPDAVEISAKGQETTAEVTGIKTVENITINEVHPLKVTFHYEANGESRDGFMDTMSVDEVSGWKVGRSIPIRYLGEEATIPDLKPVDFPFFIFKAMIYAFCGIGFVALAYSLAGAFWKVAIMKNGVVRPGKLLAWVPVSSRFTWVIKTRFEMTYSFTGINGKETFGASLTRDLALLNEKKKGDEIQVLVLPDNLKKSLAIDGPILAKITTP